MSMAMQGGQALPSFCGIVGRHPLMLRLFANIGLVARLRTPVVIQGPSGAGKELVAVALHDLSGRTGRLIAESAAAMPEHLAERELFGAVMLQDSRTEHWPGLVNAAHGGSLHLDHAGELSLTMQPTLLRMLVRGTFQAVGSTTDQSADVRLIATVQEPVDALVATGRWRRDFARQIAAVTLVVPSLQERASDIGLLANYWMISNDRPPLPSEDLHRLAEYAWPGNMWELRWAVGRAIVAAGDKTITVGDVLHAADRSGEHALVGTDPQSAPSLEDIERKHLEATVRTARFNVREAAAQLDVPVPHLCQRLEALGLMPRRRTGDNRTPPP